MAKYLLLYQPATDSEQIDQVEALSYHGLHLTRIQFAAVCIDSSILMEFFWWEDGTLLLIRDFLSFFFTVVMFQLVKYNSYKLAAKSVEF